MRSVIFYARINLNSGAEYAPVRHNDETIARVRAEPFDGDVQAALDAASPRPDEVVLNTMPHPGDPPALRVANGAADVDTNTNTNTK